MRRELGIRTVFNLLGPHGEPGLRARRQLVGVFDPALTETVARVLATLGSEKVFVVHGSDGSDEVTVAGETRVTVLDDGRVRHFSFAPESVGIERANARALTGGTPEENAKTIVAILDGARGPKRRRGGAERRASCSRSRAAPTRSPRGLRGCRRPSTMDAPGTYSSACAKHRAMAPRQGEQWAFSKTIVAAKREEVAQRGLSCRSRRCASARFARSCARLPRRGVARAAAVIAELKVRTPTIESFAHSRSLLDLARNLRGQRRLGHQHRRRPGALRDLVATSPACATGHSLPVIAKDFVVDPYQVCEARARRRRRRAADRALARTRRLRATLDLADELGLTRWWRRTRSGDSGRTRVRCADGRDQQPRPGTMMVSLDTTRDWPIWSPPTLVLVSESGICTRDIARLGSARCSCIPGRRKPARLRRPRCALARLGRSRAYTPPVVEASRAMSATKVKICGLTSVGDAALAASLGADYLGVIFADSPRRVASWRVRAASAPRSLAGGSACSRTQPLDEVVETALASDVDLVQLHGTETPTYCDEVLLAPASRW